MGWTGAQQPDDEIVFFQSGSMVFGLWTKLGGHGAPGIELAHNVRSPSEVDSVLSQAERSGGKVLLLGNLAELGGYTGVFADLDCYGWDVYHNTDMYMTNYDAGGCV